MSDLTELLKLGAMELEHKVGVNASSTVFGQALSALEAQEALIKEMVNALTALRDETVVCCPDCADQVDAALSKAPSIK